MHSLVRQIISHKYYSALKGLESIGLSIKFSNLKLSFTIRFSIHVYDIHPHVTYKEKIKYNDQN